MKNKIVATLFLLTSSHLQISGTPPQNTKLTTTINLVGATAGIVGGVIAGAIMCNIPYTAPLHGVSIGLLAGVLIADNTTSTIKKCCLKKKK